MIKRWLCRKKVLVVLDVDDTDQLEALAGSRDWFGEGSRLIITTRDEHVLTRNANVIYSVKLLSDSEARVLFRRHAYQEGSPVEDYGLLSRDVISYCDGLPLALKILGSFLYDKDKDEWISALAKLRDIPNSKIMDKLRISYDGLTPYEKALFLDIACFFSQGVKSAKPILHAFGFSPVIGLKVLAQKSLVTVSDGRFHLHDLVKEMAHYVVRGEHPEHPEEHSRVWRPEDIANIWLMGTPKENHKIEALVYSYRSLDFSGDDRTTPKFHDLYQVAANIKNLRLFWHLPNLKILDLSDSRQLIRTPHFGGLPRLERLILKGCWDLKEIHPSIGHLGRLVLLDMQECKRLESFPPIIQMGKLETLNLSGCIALKKFPEIQTSMDSLVKLCLDWSAIEIVPSSIEQYCTNLVTFDLSECRNLKRIEGNFQPLKRLKKLSLAGCHKLEKLAEDFFDVECCLEVFDLSDIHYEEEEVPYINCFMNCFGFSYHDSISMRYTQFAGLLRKLNLSDCKLGDGDIPSCVFELLNLQVLDVSYNSFPILPSLSRLQSLKSLNLEQCNALVELPDLPSSIAALKASYCSSLEQVGDLSVSKCLWLVSFKGCEKLGGWESVVISLFQETVVRNNFMSVELAYVGRYEKGEDEEGRKYRLQLPEKWYDNFSGFLLCIGGKDCPYCCITIKHEEETETCMVESLENEWKEFEQNLNKGDEYCQLGYVPFASLTHTSWWNSSSKSLSFYLTPYVFHSRRANIKVGLVPKSKSDLVENAKAPIVRTSYWEREEVFSIKEDSKLSIAIEWRLVR